MRKSIILLTLLCSGWFASLAQESTSLVKWMTIEQAAEKMKTEKRKIFVDVYTDWCRWCKVMDNNTFSDPEVAKLLNNDYYPVKFNAEQKEDVTLQGYTYKYVGDGNGHGYNQLAAALLNNQLSYPTSVFIFEDFKTVVPAPGYRQPADFHKLLSYFAEDFYTKGENSWEEFGKVYKSPYVNN